MFGRILGDLSDPSGSIEGMTVMGGRAPSSYLDRARVYQSQVERYLIEGDEALAMQCDSYARRSEDLARMRWSEGERIFCAGERLSLWRGVNIVYRSDVHCGDDLLDYLIECGRRRGHGLGRHWTVMRDVAVGYAEAGEFDSAGRNDGDRSRRLEVLVRCGWDGAGLDGGFSRGVDFPGIPARRDLRGESARTLCPGTVLVVDDVRTRRLYERQWTALSVRYPVRAA